MSGTLQFPLPATAGDVYEKWLFNGRAWDPLPQTPYVPLAGNVAMTGPIYYTGPFVLGTSLVNKDYVDQAVAQLQVFEGAWDAATNTPDLTLVAVPTNGSYYIASSAGTAPAALPGIGGQTVRPGDMVVWQTGPPAEWAIIPGAGMTQAEADVRYLQLAGGTLTGTLTLAGNAAAAPGGNLQPVPLQQLNAVIADYVQKAGDTMTGALAITGATGNLSVAGTSTLTGNTTVGGTLGVTGQSTLAALTANGNTLLAQTSGSVTVGTAGYNAGLTVQGSATLAPFSGSVTIGNTANNIGASLTVVGAATFATLTGAVNVGNLTNNTTAAFTAMGTTILNRMAGSTTIGNATNNPNPLLQCLGYIRSGSPTGTAVTTAGSVNVADFYYRNGQTIGSAWELLTYTPNTGFGVHGNGIWIRLNRVLRMIAFDCDAYTIPNGTAMGATMGQVAYPAGFVPNKTKRVTMIAESTLDGQTGRSPINIDVYTFGDIRFVPILQGVLNGPVTGLSGVRLFGNHHISLDA